MENPTNLSSRPAAGSAQVPLEPMAVASVVSAGVLGLCPLGALAAIILGAIGLRRIRRSQGARRGVGLARTGMALGIFLPLIEIVVMMQIGLHVQADLDRVAIDAITVTLSAKDSPPGIWVPVTDGGASPAELQSLRAALPTALGPLREIRIVNRDPKGIPLQVSIAFIAQFESGSAFGSAEFVQGPPDGFEVTLRMKSLEIDVQGVRTRVPSSPTPATP